MEHHWTRKGQVLLAMGFLISPDGSRYIGYKIIPEYGGKNMRKKPRIELCNGILHRCYIVGDDTLHLRSQHLITSEHKTNGKAASTIQSLFNKKLMDGWMLAKPAYPSTLLRIPWKHIRQVKLL